MNLYPDNIFAGMVANRAAELPDFEVLTIEGGGTRPDEVRSYSQLWDNGQRLAQVMQDLGITPGERVALLMANHVEFVEAMVAASISGVAVVPIDARTKGDKLRFLLTSSQCCAVFAADYALPHLQPLRPRLNGVRWVLAFATDEGEQPLAAYSGVVDWEAVAPLVVPDLPMATIEPDAALELIFTSGTTGDPKGIVMTHRRYCDTAALALRLFGYREGDVLYSGLSLTHANAQLLTLGAALACRLLCVLSRRFTKSRLWDITRKYGATSFTLLGGMTTAVYAEPPWRMMLTTPCALSSRQACLRPSGGIFSSVLACRSWSSMVRRKVGSPSTTPARVRWAVSAGRRPRWCTASSMRTATMWRVASRVSCCFVTPAAIRLPSSTTATQTPLRVNALAAGCTWATWCTRMPTGGCISTTARAAASGATASSSPRLLSRRQSPSRAWSMTSMSTVLQVRSSLREKKRSLPQWYPRTQPRSTHDSSLPCAASNWRQAWCLATSRYWHKSPRRRQRSRRTAS